jgi:methionine sulfoxide reductase heme-binding subunit
MINKTKLTIFIFLLLFIFPVLVSADEKREVKYESDVIIDSDLDGLTDEGERQIFLTDPQNPDTDADGISDGAETLGQTNPLDPNEPKVKEVVVPQIKRETPWVWYATRASALMGFLLLYLSFFFGLAIRTPGLKKIVSPANSFSVHSWISLQALIFAAIHGLSLFFDKFLNFSLKDILVPLALKSNVAGISPELVAIGIISFYIMLALVLTSYFRKFISHQIWRALHFLNAGLYILVFIHALYLGTDLRSGWPQYIFIGANVLLGFLILTSLINKIISSIRDWRRVKDENLYPSNSEGVEK